MNCPFSRRWFRTNEAQGTFIFAAVLARLRTMRANRDWPTANSNQRISEFRFNCIATVRQRVAALLLPAEVAVEPSSRPSRIEWNTFFKGVAVAIFCVSTIPMMTESPKMESSPRWEVSTFAIPTGLPYLPEQLALDKARETLVKFHGGEVSHYTPLPTKDAKDSLTRYGLADAYLNRATGSENSLGFIEFNDPAGLSRVVCVEIQSTQLVCSIWSEPILEARRVRFAKSQ